MSIWQSIGEFFRQLRAGSGGFMLVKLDDDETVERLYCVRCGSPMRITIQQGEGEIWTKCTKCTRDEHRLRQVCLFFRVKKSS
jgi:hypothetical protein